MQQELAANEAELGANIKEQVRDTFCLGLPPNAIAGGWTPNSPAIFLL